MKKIFLVVTALLLASVAFMVTSCEKDGTIPETAVSITNITPQMNYTDGTISCQCNAVDGQHIHMRVLISDSIDPPRSYDMKKVGDNLISERINDLRSGNTYYFVFELFNSVDTLRDSEIHHFDTKSTTDPTISTPDIVAKSDTVATIRVSITDDGGYAVTERGICWATNPDPSYGDNHIAHAAGGTGAFECYASGLIPVTDYWVRGYAVTNGQRSYGPVKQFKTDAGVPKVATDTVTNITQSSGRATGHIVSDGGSAITERGVCYSTNPSAVNTKRQGTGTGNNITVEVNGLDDNTTYYVRAYATNSKGTAYGDVKSFTTSEQRPSLSNVHAVTGTTTHNSIQISYTVGSGAHTTIAEHGLCWSSTVSSPTISNTHISNGSGTGTKTATISNLQPSTTYYVCAYAKTQRENKIEYSSPYTFTTTADASIPTVTTAAVSSITSNSATCGGTITIGAGGVVTARGVCWGTTATPTVSGAHTTDGSGSGTFSSAITGLSSSTTYYVRAYATTSTSTYYGSAVSFTTTTVSGSNAGTLPGLFSVSATQHVKFSQGNLQYQASTNTWRFATNQYTIQGTTNGNISSSYSNWIDLFGWGTGSNPTQSSTVESNYGSFSEWGNNAISNGGGTAGVWRTLSSSEWNYLMNLRTNATSKRGNAQVAGVYGMVILPDTWTLPSGCTFSSTGTNTYTASQWTSMQAAGAVFLPAGGYRVGTTVNGNNDATYCYYWTASANNSAVSFNPLNCSSPVPHFWGLAVRLVKNN